MENLLNIKFSGQKHLSSDKNIWIGFPKGFEMWRLSWLSRPIAHYSKRPVHKDSWLPISGHEGVRDTRMTEGENAGSFDTVAWKTISGQTFQEYTGHMRCGRTWNLYRSAWHMMMMIEYVQINWENTNTHLTSLNIQPLLTKQPTSLMTAQTYDHHGEYSFSAWVSFLKLVSIHYT